MDSDTPDIVALQELAHEYGAILCVDVAHDLGCLGPDGRGHIGAQGMTGKVDVVMGSFSKTFASNGGFVACNRAQREGISALLQLALHLLQCPLAVAGGDRGQGL